MNEDTMMINGEEWVRKASIKAEGANAMAPLKDGLRVRNCGVEIYEYLKEGIGGGFEGGVIIHEGERK